jgi:hypothetical protein
MTEPLSWMWVIQILVLILFLGLILSLLLLLALRRRPVQFHVLTYEKNQTWEEVKAQIEARSPLKPEWKYTEVAKERGFKEENE